MNTLGYTISPGTATESAEGLVEFATQAEVDAVSAVDAVVRARHLRAKVETGNGNAISVGDLGGDARGSGSITIQPSRFSSGRVASGSSAIAIGAETTASGSSSVAVGGASTASSFGALAVGYGNTASGSGSSAVGLNNTASGYYSSAIGFNNTASGYGSSALGFRAKTTIANTAEIGYWGNFGTNRNGAVRIHGTGQVAMTIQNRATAYTDGGATAGSEADNTVIREGFAFRRNGNEILIDLNVGGTVTTLSLGTAA